MNIIPPTPPTIKIQTKPIADVTKIWKVGQVLNATAQHSADAQDIILMRMGESLIEAKTPIALKTGEPIKLLIKSLGEVPVLTILKELSSPRLAEQNLRNFISQQQDLSGLLLLSQKIVKSPVMPKILKQQLLDLRRQLPEFEQVIQAKNLKTIIQNSGVFLEPRLNHVQTLQQANQQTDVFKQDMLKQDIKAQLLKISAQLQNEFPELAINATIDTSTNLQGLINRFIKGEVNLIQLAILLTNKLSKNQQDLIQQVLTGADKTLLPEQFLSNITLLLNYLQQQNGSQQMQAKLASLLSNMALLQDLKKGIDRTLAKITSQQLIPLTREADSLLLLLFDLYIKVSNENHLIQFRMEQEKLAQEDNPASWKVTLNFNFKQLGSVQAQLHLTDNSISTLFHAEKDTTVNTISAQIDWLDRALKQIGFDTVKLGVTQNKINQAEDIPDHVHLLDEKI